MARVCQPIRFVVPARTAARLTVPLQGWLDAVFLQDIGDRAGGNHASQIGQRALNPPVTPVRFSLAMRTMSTAKSLEPGGNAFYTGLQMHLQNHTSAFFPASLKSSESSSFRFAY